MDSDDSDSLNIGYSDLCWRCKRFARNSNKDRIKELLSKFSAYKVSLLTGIPTSTVKRMIPENGNGYDEHRSGVKRKDMRRMK